MANFRIMGVKWLQRKGNHLPKSITEFKTSWG